MRHQRHELIALALTLAGCVVGSEPARPDPEPRSAVEQAPEEEPPSRPSASIAAPSATVEAPASPEAPCPEDMVDIGRACIDRFEAPNEVGKKPLRMQSALDGEAHCRERGKRLCDEDEWVRACEGSKSRPFPYGAKYEAARCNDDGKFIAPSWKTLAKWPSEPAKKEVERLDQSEPSGARSGCVSEEGVFDLTGNVGEWVLRTRENETNHGHVVKGCFWGRCFRPPHTPSCEYVNFAHPSGWRSYELGFRCCKERSKPPSGG